MSKNNCISSLYYGTDYHSHLGTEFGGIAFINGKNGIPVKKIHELAARKAIKAIEGKDIEDVSEYLDPNSNKFKKMIDWIAKDLGVTSIKYQILEDMIKAIGLPKEKLCLYCWNGEDFQRN